MIEVIHLENSSNPKELIKKLANEGKKRRKDMNDEMGTDETAKSKKAPAMK